MYEASRDGRLEVARVNGVPVYGDCVALQAGSLDITREQALQQCIDFELLAQAARDGGYLSHPSVVQSSRTESVRALLEHTYPMREPSQVPVEEVRVFWQSAELRERYNHPEARALVACRVELADDGQAAKRAAQTVYDRLPGGSGVSPTGAQALERICRQVDQTTPQKLTVARHRAYRRGYLKPIAEALWALENIGSFTEPVKADDGWYVVMLEDILPARATSFEDAVPDIQEGLFRSQEARWWRDARFAKWYEALANQHAVESFPDRIPEGL